MIQSFINSRFDQIEKRFNEVQVLLDLSAKNRNNIEIYQSLCRSAHVLLVSHFEGLYKDICKDVVDDLNSKTNFYEVKKTIFNTHCEYFINHKDSNSEINYKIKKRLIEAFQEYPSKIKVEPFLFVDNKNPAPQIIETILSKFGVKNFFHLIEGSDLDLVFEDQQTEMKRLRDRLHNYVKRNTTYYPYTVDSSFYHPIEREKSETKKVTLWEDFINNFLKERHNIIHGNTLENSNDNESLYRAKVKIEILIYAFMINICSAANPLFLLSEAELSVKAFDDNVQVEETDVNNLTSEIEDEKLDL